jgi:hypothetical protein
VAAHLQRTERGKEEENNGMQAASQENSIIDISPSSSFSESAVEERKKETG